MVTENSGAAAGAAVGSAEGRGWNARLRAVAEIAAHLQLVIAEKRCGQRERGSHVGLVADARHHAAHRRPTLQIARVSEKTEGAGFLAGSLSTDREATAIPDGWPALRKIHFHSSVMRVPLSELG